MRIIDCNKCNKYRKYKSLKHHTFFYKTQSLFIICDKCGSKNETIFKEKESIEILKFLV